MAPTNTLLALALSAGSALAGFAPATWDTSGSNPAAQGIVHVQTTLTVPALTTQGLLLWPGLYIENNDLVQTLLVNDPAYLSSYCGTSENSWCVLAYQLEGSTGDAAQGALVSPGDQIVIEYDYDSSSGMTTQTASVNGNTVSSVTQPGALGYRFADTIECHANVGATPEHTYTDTTITLAGSNPSFNANLNAADGATPTSFSSTDGGTTWYIQTITLPASTCECNATGNC